MIVVKVAPTGGAPLVMEMMMKRLFAAAVAVAALAAAAPANADPHRYDGARAHQGDRYDHRGSGYQERRVSREDFERLQFRIDRGVRTGALTRPEARRLNYQLADLRERARFYWRTDGLSWRERQDLEARFDRLSFEVRRQVRDDDYARRAYRS